MKNKVAKILAQVELISLSGTLHARIEEYEKFFTVDTPAECDDNRAVS